MYWYLLWFILIYVDLFWFTSIYFDLLSFIFSFIFIIISDFLPLRQVHAKVAESVKDIFSRYKAKSNKWMRMQMIVEGNDGHAMSCTSDSNDPWNDPNPCLKFGGFHKWGCHQIIHLHPFATGCSIINHPFSGTTIQWNLRISPKIVAGSIWLCRWWDPVLGKCGRCKEEGCPDWPVTPDCILKNIEKSWQLQRIWTGINLYNPLNATYWWYNAIRNVQ